MQVQESNLQYFRTSLSYHFPLGPLFCLFLRGVLDRFYCSDLYAKPLNFSALSHTLLVFVALRPMSTAMVIAGWSVNLTTLFPGQA